MNVYYLVEELRNLAEERSKKYNEGKIRDSFALEWFMMDMQSNLDNMELSEKQLKVLEARIAKMKKIIEEEQ